MLVVLLSMGILFALLTGLSLWLTFEPKSRNSALRAGATTDFVLLFAASFFTNTLPHQDWPTTIASCGIMGCIAMLTFMITMVIMDLGYGLELK